MPTIGPWSFAVMDGRLQVAAPRGAAGSGPAQWSPRKPTVAECRTVESFTAFSDAWARAARYRQTIGACAAVQDGTGITCPAALIADVRTSIRMEAGAAVLIVAWTLVPALDYGDAGQALFYTPSPISPVQDPALIEQPLPAGAAVTVGGIPFATATGDLQWPVTDAQLDSVTSTAEALGIADVVQSPSDSQGNLETTTPCANDAAAFRLMRECRSLPGSVIAVNLGGVLIRCAVLDVTVDWRDANQSPTGSVFVEATWNLQPQTPGGSASRSLAVVQVASTWGAWQTRKEAICHQARQGLGMSLGAMTWTESAGDLAVSQQGRTVQPEVLVGKWVRILLKQNARDRNPSPIWWGVVTGQTFTGGSDQPGTLVSFSAASVLYQLSKVSHVRWYEKGLLGTEMDPGQVLPFNERSGGDRDGNLLTDAGTPLAVHDRNVARPAGGAKPLWTAEQAVRLLVQSLNQQFPNQGLRWEIGGQVAALQWHVALADVRGMDALQALGAILRPELGVTFREVVDDAAATVTLEVRTATAAAVALPEGGTLPANDEISNPDLTDNATVRWSYALDETQTYDRIFIEGEPHTIVCTLRYSNDNPDGAQTQDSLARAWTAAEQTAWDAATDEEKQGDLLGHVWRRFRPASGNSPGNEDTAWKGSVNGGITDAGALLMQRTLDAGVETGELSFSASALPQTENLRFTRDLAIAQGVEFTGSGSDEPAPGKPRMQPVLMAQDGSDYSEITHDYQITVEDDSAAFLIGRNLDDQEALKEYLEAGGFIHLTVGLVSPLPWRIEYRRPVAEQPRNWQRVLIIKTDLTWQRIVAGALVGLENDPPEPKRQAAELNIGKDFALDQARQLLELAKLWHVPLGGGFAYDVAGTIDTATETGPGSMVGAPTLLLNTRPGSKLTWAPTVNLLVTGRSWTFELARVGTQYATERLMIQADRAHLAADVVRHLGDLPDRGYRREQGL